MTRLDCRVDLQKAILYNTCKVGWAAVFPAVHSSPKTTVKSPLLPENYSLAMIVLMAAFFFMSSFGITTAIIKELQEPAQTVYVD